MYLPFTTLRSAFAYRLSVCYRSTHRKKQCKFATELNYGNNNITTQIGNFPIANQRSKGAASFDIG